MRGVAKAAPHKSQGPKEDYGPEKQRQAEFEQNAKYERHGRKNGADSFHEGVSKGKGRAGEICLEGSAIVFEQNEMNVGLRDRRDQVFVLALGIGNDFTCLGDVFFESDGVAKLAFSFALEFLKTREIALRGRKVPFGRGEFDGGIFASF